MKKILKNTRKKSSKKVKMKKKREKEFKPPLYD